MVAVCYTFVHHLLDGAKWTMAINERPEAFAREKLKIVIKSMVHF